MLRILQQQTENVALHFFWIALPIILATVAGQLVAYRANKKRGEERDRVVKAALIDKDNKLAVLLENYRLHDHGECKDSASEGPLLAENVRFPRND